MRTFHLIAEILTLAGLIIWILDMLLYHRD